MKKSNEIRAAERMLDATFVLANKIFALLIAYLQAFDRQHDDNDVDDDHCRVESSDLKMCESTKC